MRKRWYKRKKVAINNNISTLEKEEVNSKITENNTQEPKTQSTSTIRECRIRLENLGNIENVLKEFGDNIILNVNDLEVLNRQQADDLSTKQTGNHDKDTSIISEKPVIQDSAVTSSENHDISNARDCLESNFNHQKCVGNILDVEMMFNNQSEKTVDNSQEVQSLDLWQGIEKGVEQDVKTKRHMKEKTFKNWENCRTPMKSLKQHSETTQPSELVSHLEPGSIADIQQNDDNINMDTVKINNEAESKLRTEYDQKDMKGSHSKDLEYRNRIVSKDPEKFFYESELSKQNKEINAWIEGIQGVSKKTDSLDDVDSNRTAETSSKTAENNRQIDDNTNQIFAIKKGKLSCLISSDEENITNSAKDYEMKYDNTANSTTIMTWSTLEDCREDSFGARSDISSRTAKDRAQTGSVCICFQWPF